MVSQLGIGESNQANIRTGQCLDRLHQAVMCYGDISLITNWDRLQDKTTERSIDRLKAGMLVGHELGTQFVSAVVSRIEFLYWSSH